MTVQLLGNRNFLISQNEVMLGKGGIQSQCLWCPLEEATWRPSRRRMWNDGGGWQKSDVFTSWEIPRLGAERDLEHVFPETTGELVYASLY